MSKNKKRRINDITGDSILDYLDNFPLTYKSIQLAQYISMNEIAFNEEHIILLRDDYDVFYNNIYSYFSQLLLSYLGDFCSINNLEFSQYNMSFYLEFQNEIINDEKDVLENCGILIKELNNWLNNYLFNFCKTAEFIVKAEGNGILFELNINMEIFNITEF